jgi:hypothetical protein
MKIQLSGISGQLPWMEKTTIPISTSIDYDPADEKTIEFFKIVQNKLLWAISKQTAAELVYRRVDATLPLLGMQSYDKKMDSAIRKTDVGIAKNYLNEDEIKLLGLIV